LMASTLSWWRVRTIIGTALCSAKTISPLLCPEV
jgi:hypothetical protein